MRIIYFNYLYDIRGASLGSAVKPIELFSAMQVLGHEVRMCWLREQPDAPGDKRSGSSVRSFLKRYLARFVHDSKLLLENQTFLRKERRLVEEFQPELIIARLDLYQLSAIKTARRFGLPIIIEADCPPRYEAKRFQRQYWRLPVVPKLIENWVLHGSDFVVTQSNILRDYFVRTQGVDSGRIAVVTNGADVVKFTPAEKDPHLVGMYGLAGRPVLGFIGSMSIWHGMDNLLTIVHRLSKVIPGLKILLVGTGGGLEDKVRDFAKKHDLLDEIVLTGYVPYEKVPDYVSLMDVVLAPYPNLSFFYYSPVKIFEYMAAGKPVVTTNIGQISEIITAGVDGELCEPSDLDGLPRAVENLLKDAEKRRQIGENARKTIAAKHTWLHKARAWEKICEEVLRGAELLDR